MQSDWGNLELEKVLAYCGLKTRARKMKKNRRKLEKSIQYTKGSIDQAELEEHLNRMAADEVERNFLDQVFFDDNGELRDNPKIPELDDMPLPHRQKPSKLAEPPDILLPCAPGPSKKPDASTKDSDASKGTAPLLPPKPVVVPTSGNEFLKQLGNRRVRLFNEDVLRFIVDIMYAVSRDIISRDHEVFDRNEDKGKD